jgi:carboxymethylenebutenolidase
MTAVVLASQATPLVAPADAPPGSEGRPVQWFTVTAPRAGVMLAAVARPTGRGPFPTIVLLHGSHGFAQQYVQLAQDLSRAGFLAVAPCWFAGGAGEGSRFITPIACPNASAMPAASAPEALDIVDTLVRAARTLQDARPDRIALLGHSRGGGAVLNYVVERGGVQAAVLDSAGYPSDLAGRVAHVTTPILMLHGTADSPADGGSTFTDVEMARGFEEALRRAGRPIESFYYEGGRHNGIFASPSQHDDELKRIVAFLQTRMR